MSDIRLFRLALLAWRGIQAAAPLLFIRVFSDQQFNVFAATLGTIQVMAGVIGFGQPQYAYAGLHDASSPRSRPVATAMLIITSAVTVICGVVLCLVPNSATQSEGWRTTGLVLAAYGLILVELAATQKLVQDRHRSAAWIYTGASTCFALFMLPVFVTGEPAVMAWSGLVGAAAVAWTWSARDPQWPTWIELRARLLFGAAQTLILLFSGAVPLLLHLLLPTLGFDLKGSKFISIFTTVSGVVMFIASTGMVARSAAIARQSSSDSRQGIVRTLRLVALRSLPVLPLALVASWLMLGAASPLLAVCSWLFLTSQLTVAYARYVLFARRALAWDLAANVLPFLVVVLVVFIAQGLGWLGKGPEVPVLFLTAMAMVSASLYWLAICRQRSAPGTGK